MSLLLARQRLRILRIVLAALGVTLTAWAIDPARTTSQYVREKWGADRGFPHGPVYSIAQSANGYLWIGIERGLLRFDGVNFQLIESAGPDSPAMNHVLGLMEDRNRNLWIRLQRPMLLRYKDDVFYDPRRDLAQLSGLVTGMALGPDGSPLLWVVHGEPRIVAFRDGKFETNATPADFTHSPVLALAQTADRDIWVGTRDAGLFRISHGQTLKITSGLPDLKVNAIALDGRGQPWIGTDKGVVRWDGEKLSSEGLPPSLRDVQALALMIDRDANLWVGTNSNGLARVNSYGIAWMKVGQGSDNDAVTALFEDREGDLWAGSGTGLERIRDSVFVSYSGAEGMPSESNGPIYADPAGRLWFAPVEGGLWWLHDGQPTQLRQAGLENDIVYSIAGGRDGLWLGRQRGGLTQLRIEANAVVATTFTTARGLAQKSVYSVYESRDGTVWAGTLSGGVSRLSHGQFTTFTKGNGLVSNTVAAIAEDADGNMWFATPRGLNQFAHDRWQSWGTHEGLPSEKINCLLVDSASVLWVGTERGLSFWQAGKIHGVAGTPDSLREPILGLAEDRNGSLWIATTGHVVRVNREHLLRGTLADGDAREFTVADGLRGIEGVPRSRSVVADSAGRIWFSLNRGISLVDPARLRNNSALALVHIRSIAADGASFNRANAARIPGGKKRLTIDYGAVILSVPDHVRYRYLLENFDRDWSSPVTAREAVYTNLPPGPYRFRVTASNPDGVWNPSEDVLAFVVDPLFWQTWWFRLAVVLGCALAVIAIYQIRVHQLTRSLNLRFEERLAERTRIAQELHDTLLQGFVSASMQVHVAADMLAEESKSKQILARALVGMKQVIDEGRNAVRGLRLSRSASLDLELVFSRIQQEMDPAGVGNVDFRVIVDGRQRPLHPLLRDEVYRIGREALINAFRHAQARHIEIELKFSSSNFHVVVRDDGMGIDPAIVAAGREGHWGLSGMRERADRIGAHFHVFSRASEGTEIELTVPAYVAFADHTSRWWKWIGKRGEHHNGSTGEEGKSN
jgi:ligand-binding sensor domain-containing protein/signal transduction histidine kinase